MLRRFDLASTIILHNAASFALLLIWTEPAHADSLPRAVVLRPHTEQAERDADVNRKLVEGLESLAVVELLPQPALDLEAAQLAIDCMDESVRCLREVAQGARADVLIAPSIVRGDGGVELRILYFDAESGKAPTKVVRRQAGTELGRATLDAIPDMLRALFGIEKPEPESSAAPAQAPAEEPQPARAGHHKAVPLGAVVLGGAGVVALAGGITLGIVMRKTEHDYAARPIQTAAQVEAADAQRKQGERQALIANVLLGTGAAAIVASVIWLAAGMAREDKQQAALVPMLGSDRAGLWLVGYLEARR